MPEIRKRIIESAGDLFADRSYPNVSTKQIAERADVNESTVLRRFGSKEGVGRAVARSLTDWYATETTPESIRNLDLETITKFVVMRNADHLTKRWVRIYLSLWQYFPDELSYETPTQRHKYFIEKVAECQRSGRVVPGRPEDIAAALLYALYGFFITQALGLNTTHSAGLDYVNILTEIWLRGITP